jgi:diguanylate cyclase (GGDEF)-like protein
MAHQLRESFNTLEKRIEERTVELRNLNQELQRLANIDGLTQVANRRYFDQYLEREWNKLIQEENPLSLILCDVDFFKKYNDTYGHQAGDLCLQQVAQVLKSSVHRATDLVARYGGEEFAIVLSNTDQRGALHVAQVIFNKLEKLGISHCGSEMGTVTVSMGISTVVPTPRGNLRSLLTATDLALYTAKSKGRNQYCIASQSSGEDIYLGRHIIDGDR